MRTTNILVLLLVAILIVGCAEAGTNVEVNANVSSDGSAETKTETTTQTQSNGGVEAELLGFFGAKSRLEWKVDYDMKNTADGKTMTGKLSQYMKTEDNIRMDMASEGFESRTYMTAEAYTTCTKMDDEWNCYKLDASEENTDYAADVEAELEEDPDSYSIEADGTMNVAGTTAKCYKASNSDEPDVVTKYCFSKEGVLLYTLFSSADVTSEMKATAYSTKVSDSDFELPLGVEVKSMTQIAGGDACSACNYLSGDMKDECLASC